MCNLTVPFFKELAQLLGIYHASPVDIHLIKNFPQLCDFFFVLVDGSHEHVQRFFLKCVDDVEMRELIDHHLRKFLILL